MAKFLFVALGGALGSVLRYTVQGWVQRLAGESFPLGTLAVNVAGCLLVGIAAGLFAGSGYLREEYRVGLMVGILGGFTTFSSFGLETYALASAGQLRLALLNITLSCALGLTAVWIGYRYTHHWFGA